VTDRATYADLADVFVLELYRGAGLARRMLDALFAEVVANSWLAGTGAYPPGIAQATLSGTVP